MKKAFGRSLNDFLPLRDAENRLLHACASGADLTLSNGLPEQKTPENSLRAEFVRFLALGGDDSAPIHEMGVQVEGAWIEDSLNLDHCTVSRIWLGKCHFEETLEMRNAQFQGSLHLNGSSIPGVKGDGLICHGSVFFRSGVIRDKAFEMGSSTIHGDLEFSRSSFFGGHHKDNALILDRSKIHGSLIFNKHFQAIGKVGLSGIFVSGSLEINQASIQRTNDQSEYLLDLKGTCIEVAFIFRDMLSPVNQINLEGIRVKYLVDEYSSWGNDLNFGSCHFEFFQGVALRVSASERSSWLKKQKQAVNSSEFDVNERPWMSVVNTLVRSGLPEHAVQVGMAFESLKYFGNKRSAQHEVNNKKVAWARNSRVRFARYLKRFLGLLSYILIGYGYRPWRLLGWFVLFWFAGGGFYWYAALENSVLPSSPLVYLNKDLSQGCEENWVLCKLLPEAHSAFSPFVYSLDVLLPVVDLDQEKNWTMKTPGIKENFLQLELWSFFKIFVLVSGSFWVGEWSDFCCPDYRSSQAPKKIVAYVRTHPRPQPPHLHRGRRRPYRQPVL